MSRSAPSVVRHILTWWFDAPYSPWVSVMVGADFTPLRAYLDALAARPGPKVTVQHLLAAAIARTLRDFPEANARIFGRRIVPQPHVGVAMPVNLLGHAAGDRRELSALVLEKAETKTLRAIAAECSGLVERERRDEPTNPLVRPILRAMERMPAPAVHRTLDALDRAMRRPAFARVFYEQLPLTTALTNPGAALALPPGAHLKGGAFSLPNRLLHIGTIWGVAPVQDEVLAIDGLPQVRPVLPVLLVFDHRLIDGVRAGQLLQRLARILQDPGAEFGPDGQG